MSWSKRKPKPEIGQYRIVEVVLRNGNTSYTVERYDWGGSDYKRWEFTASFRSKPEAFEFIYKKRQTEVVSSVVVWP